MENQIVIFQTDNGQTSIDVRLESETVWLNTSQMSLLFDRDEKTIRKHVDNVFSEDEVSKEDNTHFLRVVGVNQPVAFYSLDVIISVGYRVKSQCGVQFRRWANRVLKEYLLNGYVLNERIRKRLPCCFISSRRTTHLLMATSELPLHYFCGFSTITASFIARMAVSALPTIP